MVKRASDEQPWPWRKPLPATALSAELERMLAELADQIAASDVHLWLSHEGTPAFRRADGWWACAGGVLPAEGEGMIGRHPLYFRAEDGRWSLVVGEADTESAITVGWRAGGLGGWTISGDDHRIGDRNLVTHHAAIWELLAAGVEAFRRGMMERLEAEELHDQELERRLVHSTLCSIRKRPGAFTQAEANAWFERAHDLLHGRTPSSALLDGEYVLVSALAEAEVVAAAR